MTNQATQQRVGVTAATQRSPSGTGLRMLFAEKKSRSRFSKYQSGTVSVWEKVKAESEHTSTTSPRWREEKVERTSHHVEAMSMTLADEFVV